MTGVWGQGSRSVPASTVPDAQRVPRATVKPLTPLQVQIVAALTASTTGPLTCDELAVEIGAGATAKGVALTMGALIKRGLVRWCWVHRGGSGRARKGFSLVPGGEA